MPVPLTALIVDDEERAVALLHQLLLETAQFSRIDGILNPADVLVSLDRHTPDLLFLDILMPGQSGIDLLSEIHRRQIRTEVIFVTAHDQFALDALRHHAFGYLLKPVNRKELEECIAFLRSRAHDERYSGRLLELVELLKRQPKMRINTRSGSIFIDPQSILYCVADGNYTTIHLGDKEHVCSLQLGEVQDSLPNAMFARVGRSLILNLSFIHQVDRKRDEVIFEKQAHTFKLKVTRSQLKELDRQLGQWQR